MYDHTTTRAALADGAEQLRRVLTQLAAAIEHLPEVSEDVLALEEAPDVAAALRLAVEHVAEELPELVDALEHAARATDESLLAAHHACRDNLARAERLLARPPRRDG